MTLAEPGPSLQIQPEVNNSNLGFSPLREIYLAAMDISKQKRKQLQNRLSHRFNHRKF